MRKYLLLAVVLLCLPMIVSAQLLNIGGHRAPLDERNNIWLCSVPQAVFGSDYEAVVVYDEGLLDFTIDSTAVASGDKFVFEGVEGGKLYTVTYRQNDTVVVTGNITFTWLPVVEINGDFGEKYYRVGTVTVSEPDSAFAEPMLAKLKWRGIATNGSAKHKHNYRIKFINEDSTKVNRRFFGLRNDNCWILDAGQMDFLRVRNRVSTDLWLDMARKPWYADTVENVRNGSRGQMVEVLLNGQYLGIYNMCEPIDRKQLKLKRYDEETNTFHGQTWMAYKWTRTVNMTNPATRISNSVTWDGFEAKYPDKDEIGRVRWTTLDQAIKFAKRSDGNKALLLDSLGYYFDLPVMQDYYVFIVALQALDNESKNIYYACQDVQEHPRLTMVPWDLDICLGQNYAPNVDRPDMVRPDRDASWISLLPMNSMINVKEFRDQVNARYRELRETKLNTDSLVNRYRTAIDELENCGAAAREEDRWSGDTDLAAKRLDLSAEMDYVENWIRSHMAYLDEYVFIDREDPPEPPVLRGDVDGDGEVGISDVNALVDILLGGEDLSEGRSDVDQDEEVTIADLNEVINIILG